MQVKLVSLGLELTNVSHELEAGSSIECITRVSHSIAFNMVLLFVTV